MSSLAVAVAPRVAALALLAALGPDAAAAAPAPAGKPSAAARTYAAMGTEVRFTIWTADVARAARAFDEAHAEIDRVERLMTDWDRPEWGPSDVVRVNAAAGKQAVKVSDETLDVVEKSLEMSRRSEGAFDITFAAMRGLWKFDEDLDPKVPAPEEIARRRKLINWRDVAVDRKARTIKLRRAGMRMGLGGIAKGYAVDVAAESLPAHGVTDALVDLTGNMVAMGHPAGTTTWRIGIRDPRDRLPYFARVELSGHGISTSGKYEQFVAANGKTYGHIMDPRTGRPAEGLLSVTLVTPSGLDSDSWDTPMFVLGARKARRLAQRRSDLEAVLVIPGASIDTVWVESSLRDRFTLEPAAQSMFRVIFF